MHLIKHILVAVFLFAATASYAAEPEPDGLWGTPPTGNWFIDSIRIGFTFDIPVSSSGFDDIGPQNGVLTGDMDLGGHSGITFEIGPRNSPWAFVVGVGGRDRYEEEFGPLNVTHTHEFRDTDITSIYLGARHTWRLGSGPALMFGEDSPVYAYAGGGVVLIDLDYSETVNTWTAFDASMTGSVTVSDSDSTTAGYVEVGLYQQIAQSWTIGVGVRHVAADALEINGREYEVKETTGLIRLGFVF